VYRVRVMNLKHIRPSFHQCDSTCGGIDQYKEQTDANKPSDREFCLPKQRQEAWINIFRSEQDTRACLWMNGT